MTSTKMFFVSAKLVPLAYGIRKLQISCVVEDDKVRPVTVWSVDQLLAMPLPSVWIVVLLSYELHTIFGLPIAMIEVYLTSRLTLSNCSTTQFNVQWCPKYPCANNMWLRIFQVGTDILEEEITKFEDLVQSVDIAAFNKVWFTE